MQNRFIILCFLVFHLVSSLSAQNPTEKKIDLMVLSKLVPMVEELAECRQFVRVQDSLKKDLADINRWTEEQSISKEHYESLKSSYELCVKLYTDNLNKIKTDLNAIVQSSMNAKNMQQAILGWAENLQTGYKSNFDQIEEIRKTQIMTKMQEVKKDNGEKAAPLIPIIINYLVKYGPEAYNLIKQYFNSEKTMKIAALKVLGNKLTDLISNRIAVKLALPAWDSHVASYKSYIPVIPPASAELTIEGVPGPTEDLLDPVGAATGNPGSASSATKLMMIDQDYNGNKLRVTDNDTQFIRKNGFLNVYPKILYSGGSYSVSEDYIIKSRLYLNQMEASAKPSEGQSFIWHARIGKTGIENAAYLALVRKDAQYSLLYGTVITDSEIKNGNVLKGLKWKKSGSIVLENYKPSQFLNISIRRSGKDCYLSTGNGSEVKFSDTMFESGTEKMYGYYNPLSKATKAKIFVDEIEIANFKATNADDVNTKNIISARPKFHVVCVGISQYNHSNLNLKFADKDARAMNGVYSRLKGADVRTYLVTNKTATKQAILDSLSLAMRNAKPKDIVVFYYSGHGMDGYLIPSDFDPNNPINTALSYESLMTILNSAKTKVKCLLVDACHSGSLGTVFPGSKSVGQDVTSNRQLNNLIRGLKDNQTFGLCSSRADEVSYEFPALQHGMFTYYLLGALQYADFNKSSIVSLGETYHFMKHYMGKSGKQTLEKVGNIQFRFPMNVLK